jgi:wyosine [tRNA(Phe)-imidazoG37] synthetase (radical SAM superfamily)
LKLSTKNKTNQKKQYIFGPVPSRRLGRSLGVDIVPFKVCSLDCVYCQLGRTTEKTIERKDYVPIDEVISELNERLNSGIEADYITISGSGEPTLHSRLGELLDRIRLITKIPIAILTNSVLFDDESVRADCCKADVVLPSLDAADQPTFERINRPCANISIENVISGLCEFKKQFTGRIWLEVFIVEGINTSPQQIDKLKAAVERIKPDKVQLNTAVRPTADNNIIMVTRVRLEQLAELFGDNAEVIADFSAAQVSKHIARKSEDVLEMLKRRPCSLNDICNGLSMPPNEVIKHIEFLRARGLIETSSKSGVLFYRPTPSQPIK